jgi:hypothetical protein
MKYSFKRFPYDTNLCKKAISCFISSYTLHILTISSHHKVIYTN